MALSNYGKGEKHHQPEIDAGLASHSPFVPVEFVALVLECFSKVAILKHSAITSTSIGTNVNLNEFVVRIRNSHEAYALKSLVIEKAGTWNF